MQTFRMSRAHVNASFEPAHVDFLVDLGHPMLNRVVDGFVKVGGVGALHAASQDASRFLLQGIGCILLMYVVTCLSSSYFLQCMHIVASSGSTLGVDVGNGDGFTLFLP